MRAEDREIVRLAVPAFLALVAEPLFLLGDAAVVGHLGTAPLAGLGIAATLLQTLVGLCVFLAYGTTASVARRLGAGDLRGALAQGIDGIWLAVLIGGLVTAAGWPAVPALVDVFGADAAVSTQAVDYLRVAILGTGPLLVMLAATGILRGLQDTRTPLLVAVAGNAANLGLNVALVYGLDWGIAGSAVGSVLAQVGSAAALTVVVVRGARRHGAPLGPDRAGIRAAARAGLALVVRTVTLRAAILVTAVAVTAGGSADRIATHQLAMSLWGFLAFTLDAIAIAAQALTGRALGAGDVVTTRRLTRRMVGWGLVAGVATGVLLAAASPFLGQLFTSDPEVPGLLMPVLLVAAVGQPLAAVVFVLDGVLIGAGDGRYLAVAGTVVLMAYAPVVLLVAHLSDRHLLVATWACFVALFIGGRAVTLVVRARGDRWLVTGAGGSSGSSESVI